MSTGKTLKIDADKIISRLLFLTGKDQNHLADAIGFKSPALSARKGRGNLPLAEIELFCIKSGYDFEWVMNGDGEMRRDTNSNHQTVTISEHHTPYDDEISAAVAKIMRELSPLGRYTVMQKALTVRMEENGMEKHTEA